MTCTRSSPRHTGSVARRLIAALAAAASVSGAAPALAQESGVRIDPESPSAKEYAIPLEDARRRADPSRAPSAPVEQGMRSSPLFGAGITRASPDASARSRRGEPGGRSSARRRRSPGAAGRAQRGTEAPAAVEGARRGAQAVTPAIVQPDAGGSAALFLGAAGLVLGLGVAGGVLLRRRFGG